MKLRLILALLLLRSLGAAAQNGMLEGRVIDGRTGRPVALATIRLQSLSDSTASFLQTSAADGAFRIAPIYRFGSYLMQVSRGGYAGYLKVIQVSNEVRRLPDIVMLDSVYMLQEATLRSRRSGVRLSNDTIEYNARYFRTNPDMDAVYLINKLPGIDLTGRNAMGDSISRIAINGIVIFNDHPAQILAQLPAGAIERVQLYNDSADLQARPLGTRQYKVLNVVTTNGYLTGFKGKFYAGSSVDPYFTLGGNAIRQQAGSQLSVNASSNRGRVDFGSYYDPTTQFEAPGISWSTSANVAANRKQNKRTDMNASLSLRNTVYDVERSDYFQFSDRNSVSSIDMQRNLHSASRNLDLSLGLTRSLLSAGKLVFSSSLQASGMNAEENRLGALRQDSAITNTANVRTETGSSCYANVGVTGYFKGLRKFDPVVSVFYRYGAQLADAHNMAEVRSPDTSYRSLYRNLSDEADHRIILSLSGKRKLGAANQMGISLRSVGSKAAFTQDQLRFSALTGDYTDPDPVFSSKNDVNTVSNTMTVSSAHNFSGGKHSLELVISGLHNGIYMAPLLHHDFLNLAGNLVLKASFAALHEFRINLEKSVEVPAAADLNPLVVARDALFFRTGNPDLQPVDRYSANITYKRPVGKPGSVFYGSVFLLGKPDNIIDNRIIASPDAVRFRDTPIPAGATLIYRDNSGTYSYGSVSLSYETTLEPLRLVCKLRAGAERLSAESMLNGFPSDARTGTFHASATFSSIISSAIDFTAYASWRRLRTELANGPTLRRDLDEYKLNALLVIKPNRRQSLQAAGNYQRVPGLAASQINSSLLANLTYSVKTLKKDQLTLSATVHDLLNSYRYFSYELSPFDAQFGDRNTTIYRSSANNVRRYFLLTASLAF